MRLRFQVDELVAHLVLLIADLAKNGPEMFFVFLL